MSQDAEGSQSAEAAEAAEAAQAFQAGSEQDFSSEESDTDASTAAQSRQARRALETEGGGTYCSPVNDLGFKLQYALNLDSTSGHVSKATFCVPGQESVVVHRPEPSAPMHDRLVWALVEKCRYQSHQNKEMRSAIQKAHRSLNPVRLGMTTDAGSSGGGKSADKHRAGRLSGHAEGNGDDHVAPCFSWRVQALPAPAHAAIAGKYYLEIQEGTKDSQGNRYVPNGKWGSMCSSKFPHAIINVRPRGSKSMQKAPQYVCGTCNNVKLVVRLMKRAADGNACESVSEVEVLTVIKRAHPQQQRDAWFDNEDRVQMYTYLEFADGPNIGTPVGANAFNHPPVHGKLLNPEESLPYCMGETEFSMTQGVASITTNFAKYVTHANLKKPYKDRLFRFVVKVLNPFLVDLEGFTARSLPFLVKSVLHNDVRKGVRYVDCAGEIVRKDEN